MARFWAWGADLGGENLKNGGVVEILGGILGRFENFGSEILGAVFGVVLAVILVGCGDEKPISPAKILTDESVPSDVPIAKSDANISLEKSFPLPVGEGDE